MKGIYEINVAKTEFREAYNAGNVDRLLAVFAEQFMDMSAGVPIFSGAEARSVLRSRLAKLFEQYQVSLIVTIMTIRVFGNMAFDYGCHALTLTPKRGGTPMTTRQRYFETWRRNPGREWKIDFYIDNMDVAPLMPNGDLPTPLAFCSPETHKKRNQKPARTM
jgi:ketosteroid isomerase-like protein